MRWRSIRCSRSSHCDSGSRPRRSPCRGWRACGPSAAPGGARRRARRGPPGGGGWGAAAFAGILLAGGYWLQTEGLARTSVSSAGFVTGMYVVLTPLLALALFRLQVPRAAWLGVAVATAGLALLSGVGAGSPGGDLLVLA